MSQRILTYRLGDRQINRLGYGAMQLAGPGVFGPPANESQAIQVLRDAIESGVQHIDTSDFYGPHITNKLIKRALHPYPHDLCIVTKVGALRDKTGNWLPAFSADELTRAVEDNLRHLGLDVLEVVNLRSMFAIHQPTEGSLAAPLETLVKLQARGLIRHIGLSNVTAKQVADAQKITPIACVQNLYNLANRDDDALVDKLAAQNIAWVPFSRLVASHHYSRHNSAKSHSHSGPHQCRLHLPGCCNVLQISCSSLARHHRNIYRRTWPVLN